MSPHRNRQHQRLWGECSPCTSRESPRCDLCRERLVGARRHHEAEAAQHQCWAAPGQAARAPHQTSLSLSPHCGCDGEGCCVPGHRRDAGQGTLVLEQPWAERGQSRLPFAPHPGLAPPEAPSSKVSEPVCRHGTSSSLPKLIVVLHLLCSSIPCPAFCKIRCNFWGSKESQDWESTAEDWSSPHPLVFLRVWDMPAMHSKSIL